MTSLSIWGLAMSRRSLVFSALVSSALLCLGCRGGGAEETSGKVMLDGAPLPAAYLRLVPKDARVKGPFLAKTDEQGLYSFGTIDDPGSGVPAGLYTLSITTAHSEVADEDTPTPPEKVPAPHSNTGIDFEVPAGGTTDANFDLKSK